MKFRCPCCRKEYDMEEILMDADLIACIKMLPSFGPHANVVAAYTELFGITPLKTRRRKWRLLLEEMKRLFAAESFEFNRRAFRISQAGIAEALNVVVKKNFTDRLENHNYLKKVMVAISEREEKAAGRRAEKDLRNREASLMSGGGAYATQEEQVEPPPTKNLPPVAPLTDAEREDNRRRLKNMMKEIGGEK